MAVPGMVELTIDGRRVQARPNALLLDVLRGLGIRIPTLCHDPRLTPYGGCRLCVVERRDGRGGMVPACSTPVLRGMVVETATADVMEARRRQLHLLVLNHRLECPSCERHGDCRLQDLLYEYGVPDQRLPFERRIAARDEASPVIVRDAEKCILCGKCVRLCDEVQGVAAIGIVNRGLEARVATLLDRTLDCEFCGQCVNACPVGALLATPFDTKVPTWLRETATTTCSFCSCGCQVTVQTHEGAPVGVTSHEQSVPNHGKLCVKGWLGLDVLASPERLRRPLVRRDGRLVETDWNSALDAVVGALGAAAGAGQPVVGVGSSRLTCEDAYLMQRLLRTCVPTPHVGLGPAGGVSALVAGAGPLTGAPRSTAGFEDLRQASLVLVLRGDPARTHPLVKTEIVQGVRQRGQQLVLAHALSGSLSRHASLNLPLQPGGEEALLNGVSVRLLEARPAGADFLGLPGHRSWLRSVSAYTPDVVERLAGVPEPALESLTRMLRDARKVVTVVVTGLGIPGDEAAVTRAALTLDAQLGEAGGGVVVLGEKANLQGVIDAGLDPDWLPGLRRAADAAARTELAAVWGRPVPAPADTGCSKMLGAGGVELLYLVGQDPAGAWPRGMCGAEAVGQAKFVIVQDAFLTETARQADVVLPVAILAEREGSSVGADGIRRAVRRVLAPPDRLPQDGDVFREIARRLGVALPGGAALERELQELVGWPLARRSVTGLLPVGAPAGRPRWTGMLLDVSPQLFRSGSTTDYSRLLQQLAPSAALRLSPGDAADLNVRNGDPVRLAAAGRDVLLRARIDPMVRAGTVVAPWRTRWDTVASLVHDNEPTAADVRRSS